MAGKMKFNWLFGGIGFLITFAVSWSSNLFLTSLFRSAIAFVIWFLLAYALRYVYGILQEPAEMSKADTAADGSDESRGAMVDLTTPDESEELNDLLKPQTERQSESTSASDGFSPLNPPKLVKKIEPEPEEMVKAIRHLTEE